MGVKVFETRKFSVYVEKFQLPNGKVKETAYVAHKGSVVIAPFLSSNELIMDKTIQANRREVALRVPGRHD